jgi:rare lipoprotein A
MEISIMRSFLAAVLAAFAIAGGASLPAEALTGANAATDLRGTAAQPGDERAPHVQLARSTFDDDDDDARPVRRWRDQGRWDRPRSAKPRHARSAKRTARISGHRSANHAAKPRHAARRSAHRTARNAVRTTRRAAAVQVAPAAGGSTGMASFYGGRFHGRLTASGVRFDSNAMTAAHRSLPFGTRVRVTHLGNGRTVDVRINDRGPYVGGRIIDLSRGAAGVLGMHSQGVARVQVTVMGR